MNTALTTASLNPLSHNKSSNLGGPTVTDHPGQCHCGNISFVFSSDRPAGDFTHRLCGCSFCTKHGARWISDPAGSLAITISAPSQMSPYRFGHRTAEFLTCTTCGVTPVVTSNIDGQRYAAVNLNAIDSSSQFTGGTGEFDYDAETSADRLARRRKNWIGQVTIK